jgi:hypothetical protein
MTVAGWQLGTDLGLTGSLGGLRESLAHRFIGIGLLRIEGERRARLGDPAAREVHLAQHKDRQASQLLRSFRPTLAHWRMHDEGIARWLLLTAAG